MTAFLHSLNVQWRVILVLLAREYNMRAGRNWIALIGEVSQAMAMIVFFILLRTLLGGGTHRGMETAPFIASGLLAILIFRSIIGDIRGIRGPLRGFVNMPQVTILDVLVVRYIYKLVLYIFIAIIMFQCFIFLGLSPTVEDWLALLSMYFLSSQLALYTGIILLNLMPESVVTTMFNNIFDRVVFWCSGAFFVMPEMPSRAKEILIYNPLLHITEEARSAYFLVYDSDYVNMTYVFSFLGCLFLAALICDRAMRWKWELR